MQFIQFGKLGNLGKRSGGLLKTILNVFRPIPELVSSSWVFPASVVDNIPIKNVQVATLDGKGNVITDISKLQFKDEAEIII